VASWRILIKNVRTHARAMEHSGASVTFVDPEDYTEVARVPHDPSSPILGAQVALLAAVEDLVRQRSFGTGDLVVSPEGQYFVRIRRSWQAIGDEEVPTDPPFGVRMGEILISCTDLERSRQFYERVLGCRVIAAKRFGIHLAVGHRELWLVPTARREAGIIDPLVARVSLEFLVTNYDAAVRHVRKSGALIVGAPPPGGPCIVLDPDRNAIELSQEPRSREDQ
jgi:catechol 2,3-dioxygenase-like lactoylglutathione lyase family enzyme